MIGFVPKVVVVSHEAFVPKVGVVCPIDDGICPKSEQMYVFAQHMGRMNEKPAHALLTIGNQ